jgi:hypothetical protein
VLGSVSRPFSRILGRVGAKASSHGLLTLDANVFVAALKSDEALSAACREVLKCLADGYVLVEPSIVYVEVLGVLARRVGLELAEKARVELDEILDPRFTVSCDREFCKGLFVVSETRDLCCGFPLLRLLRQFSYFVLVAGYSLLCQSVDDSFYL